MSTSKLHHKFILAFLPLILIIFLFGTLGLKTFSSIQENFSKLKKDVTPGTLTLMELKEVLISLDASINGKEINRKKTHADIERLKELIRTHLVLEKHTHEPGKKTAHDMRERAIRIMSLAQYLLNITENGWPNEDINDLHTKIKSRQSELSHILDQHLALHLDDLAKSEAFISKRYHQSIIFIWLAMGVGLLLSLGMVLYLIHTVITPIKSLQLGAKKIGEGDLDYNLVINSGDEFETLALEFREMGQKLSESYSSLDQKVISRTAELSQVNSDLKSEIQERIQAEIDQQHAEEQVHILTQELLKIQEIERQQIALDLHDNVAQELSALKIGSETLFTKQTIDTKKIRHNMIVWTDTLKECIGTVRELSYNLRPPGIEDMGIHCVVADYCANFSKKFAIPIIFTSAGMEKVSLDYGLSINIYRLVQEALNNIKVHAGNCQANVKLVASFPNIILRLEDNGCGFDLQTTFQESLFRKRLGLLGMHERVRMMGGTITVNSQSGKGTKIFIEIPWDQNSD